MDAGHMLTSALFDHGRCEEAPWKYNGLCKNIQPHLELMLSSSMSCDSLASSM